MARSDPMTFPIPDAALDDRLGWLGTAFEDLQVRDPELQIEPSKVACAYAAGFFDGEGNINIARINRADCSGPVYALNVGAAQNVIEPLLFIQHRWGGSISKRPAQPPRKGHFVWACHANVAASFLFDLVSHLTVKYERAALALEFQATKAGQGIRGDQAARRALFEPMYQRMIQLNGYPRSAPCLVGNADAPKPHSGGSHG